MAETITFTGLGSGIDLQSIVDAMVETEKLRYVQPLENWKAHWTEMSTAFSTLDTKLASFHSTVKSMDTPSEFLVNTATSSDSDVASATSASGAVEGSYEILVNQLAQTDKQIHDGIADDDTALTTGSGDKVFSYTYDGTTIDIDIIEDSTTLSNLADYINSDPSNPGVTASVLDDGLGLGTSFHLILAGETTGSSYGITINTDGSDPLTGFLAADFYNTDHPAQDALLRIDGYPDPAYITRSSNSIGDIITDVSLKLTGVGTATITISTDTTAIKENITTIIENFNEIREYIKEQTSYNTDTDQAGILLGNYGVDIVKNRINEIMSSTATAFRDGYDTFINLMQIGIKTDVDEGSETQGQLVIDEAVLNEALTENPQAVADLFSDYFTGRSAHDDIIYDSHIPGITEAGTYEIYFNHTDPTAEGNVQMRIKGGEWHNATWSAASNTITGEYGYPEAGLVVEITDTSKTISKSDPGEIDLKLGILGTLKEELDFLTNPNSGPMSVLEENYQDIIDSIDKKIEREENRITLYQQRLEERYARLEALLTDLNGQSAMLDNQLKQLEN